jgi:hypothetical protein
MNFLKMGKDILKGDKHVESRDSQASGASSGLSKNPLKLMKQFDRDGDGSITEHGS